MALGKRKQLRGELCQLSQKWCREGLPSRQQIEYIYINLSAWKKAHNIPGLWQPPPLLLTATLDDGIGMGLDLIESYAALAGMHVKRLGLLMKKENLVAACLSRQPEFVGLTILHMDSEAALAHVGKNLPESTKLIAGGPAFQYDPDLALRCNIAFVAAHVGHFLGYLLK
jgi:hypothetical protein